jgi:hypothetical protein
LLEWRLRGRKLEGAARGLVGFYFETYLALEIMDPKLENVLGRVK